MHTLMGMGLVVAIVGGSSPRVSLFDIIIGLFLAFLAGYWVC